MCLPPLRPATCRSSRRVATGGGELHGPTVTHPARQRSQFRSVDAPDFRGGAPAGAQGVPASSTARAAATSPTTGWAASALGGLAWSIWAVLNGLLAASYVVSVLFHEGRFADWGALSEFNGFVARIALASFVAYVAGQLLDEDLADVAAGTCDEDASTLGHGELLWDGEVCGLSPA